VAAAQNLHLTVRAGFSAYKGDLKPKSSVFSQGGFIGSVGLRYDLNDHIAARTYFSLTSLHADDKKGSADMKRRNLNFKSAVFDWEGGLQYNFFSLNDRWWTPYVYAGIGIFHFNPYTKDTTGAKTFLKPLSTEGEGFLPAVKDYKLTQFCIPFGIGAERALNEDMRLGLEIGYRKTFTDYIDDVSTNYVDETTLRNARGDKAVELAYRGDEVGAGPYPPGGLTRGLAKKKDGYYYIALTFTIRLVDQYRKTNGLPAYKRDKRVGCPATRY
jgi:hypothetical protein